MKKYELVEIAKAGGNIIVDASKYKKYELVEIAKANPGAVTFNI